MKKTRTKTQTGRDLPGISNRFARRLQRALVRLVHLNVREQRKIIVRLQPVKMSFRYATTFGSNTAEAYERLVLDAMIGDGTLFIRGDEAEASWKLCTPVLDYWKSVGRAGMDSYAAGSWGPPSSDALLSKNGHGWRQP